MDTFTFRRATGSDADVIASLHTESWRDAYQGILPGAYLQGPIASERGDLWRSRFSSLESDRFYVVLAEGPGGPAGFVCVLLDEDPQWGACLDNLHVLPGWRRRGLGRVLFGKAVEWVTAREPGWAIHLWVLEANDGARRLYDGLGGEVVAHHNKEIAKGIAIPSVLYQWRDLQELLNELTGGPTGTAG
ncbi:MAG: GNAT family N-acetyltransferase [Deltaproteobacteria bacterium]|nr:GNAT family N-acetyltransferase [Deltaproteobacteria bacterium]